MLKTLQNFSYKLGERVDDKTVKILWHQSLATAPQQLPLLDYHSDLDRAHARLQVIQLYAQGWSKRSISHYLHVSRPTITAWLRRFEAEELAGLADKSRAHNLLLERDRHTSLDRHFAAWMVKWVVSL